MTSDEVIRALEELYATLPTIKCQGLCWNSCGPIDMSIAERERALAAGVDIPVFNSGRAVRWAAGEPLHCPALDRWHRCSIYEIRPLVCRIWGNGRGEMACPHGCEREGPRLRQSEIMVLLTKAMLIGGDSRFHDWGDVDQRIIQDPEVQAAMIRLMGGEPGADLELMRTAIRVRDRVREEDA